MAQQQTDEEDSPFWWRQKKKAVPAYPLASGGMSLVETAVSNPPITFYPLPSPKPGDLCPTCRAGRLAYDGLFLLTCSSCGLVAEAGCFT